VGRATKSKGVAILLEVLPPPKIAQSTRGRVTLRRGVTRAAGQVRTGMVISSDLLLGIGGITRRIVTITILGEGETLTNTMKITVTMIASVTLTRC
jgi:RecA/RadA recombinase